MASQYTVDSDAISTHGTDTATLVTELETSLTNLNTKLTTLQTQWKGSASTSFQEVLLEWKDTARQVRESLDSIGQVLGQVGDQYAEVEDANTRSFGRGR